MSIDEQFQSQSEVGIKYDTNKLRWDLLPLDLIEEIVKVYTAGSVKYGDNKWQNLENGYNRYKAAMFRHLVKFEQGEEIDSETGCKHLAQVAWNAIAMLYFSTKNEPQCLINDSPDNILMENLLGESIEYHKHYITDCGFTHSGDSDCTDEDVTEAFAPISRRDIDEAIARLEEAEKQ